MRAIKYKYAVALNLSVVENADCDIYSAIEQSKDIAVGLDIKVCLTNPFNGKSATFFGYEDVDEIFDKLK